MAVAMFENHEPAVMAVDFADTLVSVLVVKVIQSFVMFVNETVWLYR